MAKEEYELQQPDRGKHCINLLQEEFHNFELQLWLKSGPGQQQAFERTPRASSPECVKPQKNTGEDVDAPALPSMSGSDGDSVSWLCENILRLFLKMLSRPHNEKQPLKSSSLTHFPSLKII